MTYLNLGIVADEIDRNFEDALRIGLAVGIRRYEIRNLTTGRAPICEPAELRQVERLAEAAGVTITALSPGLFKFTEDEAAFAREMSDVYPRCAELAHRWNLPGLITFGFHKPGATEENFSDMPPLPVPNQVSDWLARAGERAASDGLLLIVEPEPICWCDTATVTASLLARIASPALRINYDPGNVAWLQSRDPLDDFVAAAPYIANVHVKDLLPEPHGARPGFLPAGEGIIDFAAHFQALRDSGYHGPISLEPHMDGSLDTIRRCKEAFDRLWIPH